MSIRPDLDGGRDILLIAFETGHLMPPSERQVLLFKLKDRGATLKQVLADSTKLYATHPQWRARDVMFDMAINYLEDLQHDED